jgi:hypothetical protein
MQVAPLLVVDKRHRIFPVEQEMLDLNVGWEQNPGY